jgi:hypothetical protein
MGYRLDGRGIRVRFTAGETDFSFSHSAETGSGAHPVSHPLSTVGSFLGVKVGGGVKLTTRLHLMPRLRMREAVPSFSTSLHAVLINKLSTG